MKLIINTCYKIADEKLIPDFNRLHATGLLYFFRHKQLSLYKFMFLTGQPENTSKQILKKLQELNLIHKKNYYYVLSNGFNTLNKLIEIAENN